MDLHFKIDIFERIWFIYSSGIKITDDRIPPLLNLKNYKTVIFKIYNSNDYKINFLDAKKSDNFRIQSTHDNLTIGKELCINCGIFLKKTVLYEMTYKSIIIHHNLLYNTRKNIENYEIPEIIKKLYRDILPEKFQNLKDDVNWLFQNVKVCEECYYKLTQLFDNKICRKSIRICY